MEKIPNEINEVIKEDTVLDNTLEINAHTEAVSLEDLKNSAAKEDLLNKLTAMKVETKIDNSVKADNVDALALESKPNAPVSTIDISDIPMDESASFSSVLGNLDDDEPVKVETAKEVNFNFDSAEVDFSKIDESFELKAEDALTDDIVQQSKDDEKYVYKSYADQTVSIRGNEKLSFMDKISVDLNNVTIVKKSPIEQVKDINTIFNNNVATFTVTCCQSGYWASLSGLTLSEKNAINNSDGGSVFQQRQKLYQTVYNKIQNMSIPKPSYNNWLKITSFNDLSTLLFGIYCQTFIDNNDFDITCGKCGKTTPVTVNNQSLVEVRDRSVFAKRDEIVNAIENGEQLIAASIVHKDERVVLNESKIIVDVATPSLYDHLSLLNSSKEETLKDYSEALGAMLFISHMYMLDLNETYNTGRAVYYEVEDKARILNILLKLSNTDGEQLENAIQEKLGKYMINYEIHNVTCTHCKSKLPNIPIDMESVLFTRINRTSTGT